MIVKCSRLSVDAAPEDVKLYMLGRESVRLRLGMLYTVYTIFIQDSGRYLLVVDDRGLPEFLPAYLFDIQKTSIPLDWKVNLSSFGEEIFIGPEYISCDLEFIALLAERDRRALAIFFERQNLPRESGLFWLD